MTDQTVFERRRYSSVLFQHPSIIDSASLRKILGDSAGSAKSVNIKGSKWTVSRFEYLTSRSHYPSHRFSSADRRRDDGTFPHDFYVATARHFGDAPVILVASPYVRLLAAMFKTLRERLPSPAAQFHTVSMPEVYEAFATGISGMTATRVTMQMLDEPALELVSLSGRNPLNSNLHQAIEKVAAPYSLRAEVSAIKDQHTRVNFDRHGNFWWYLTAQERLVNALSLIDELHRLGLMDLGRSLPLDRADDEEEEESGQ